MGGECQHIAYPAQGPDYGGIMGYAEHAQGCARPALTCCHSRIIPRGTETRRPAPNPPPGVSLDTGADFGTIAIADPGRPRQPPSGTTVSNVVAFLATGLEHDRIVGAAEHPCYVPPGALTRSSTS
jgi:hypothetical protein